VLASSFAKFFINQYHLRVPLRRRIGKRVRFPRGPATVMRNETDNLPLLASRKASAVGI
jgi:hypothetical protein